MIIKKYRAKNSDEAMKLLREELGPEAMVLTTREIKKKGLLGFLSSTVVEITAGVEQGALEEHNHRKAGSAKAASAPTSRKANPGTTSSSLNRNLNDLKQMVRQEEVAPTNAAGTYGDPRMRRPVSAPAMSTGGDGSDQVSISTQARKQKPQVQTTTRPPRMSPSTGTGSEPLTLDSLRKSTEGLVNAFKTEMPSEVETKRARSRPHSPPSAEMSTVESLRQMIREEMQVAQDAVSVGPMDNNSEELVGSVRFLAWKGVSVKTAKEIDRSLTEHYGDPDMSVPSRRRSARLNGLKVALSKHIKTAGPITLRRGAVTTVAIVGPTGVGKTTTLAKLASQYSASLGKKVGIISLDTSKVGAREQIKALATQLSLPLTVASNARELKEGMEAFRNMDLVLIDTAGQNQYQGMRVDALHNLLSSVDDVHVMLTVSAATKDVDVIGAVRQFSRMSIDSIIVTKLDETIAHGVIVNICDKTGIPISYVTSGQDIRADLEVADPDKIARGILVEHNAEEDLKLLKLVNS